MSNTTNTRNTDTSMMVLERHPSSVFHRARSKMNLMGDSVAGDSSCVMSWGGESDIEVDLDNLSADNTDMTSPTRGAAEIKEIEAMARVETKKLHTWRIILLFVMLITGGLISMGTYLYLRNQQQEDVLHSYYLFTQTVKSASDRQYQDFADSMTTMAQTITIAGLNTNTNQQQQQQHKQKFPFVRVPMFEVAGHNMRKLSGVEFVAWSPIVTASQRSQWMTFSRQQQDWYNESKALVRSTTTSSSSHEEDAEENHDSAPKFDSSNHSAMSRDIWHGYVNGTTQYVTTKGPYTPIWQCSPPPFSLSFIQFDLSSESYFANMLPALKAQARMDGMMTAVDPTFAQLVQAIGEVHNAHYVVDDDNKKSTTSTNATKTKNDPNDAHPHSVYVHPVLDGINDPKSNIVGYLSSIVSWDKFLSNLLPEGVEGITAVLENTCGQYFTYTLKGKRAVFVGVGNLHDKSYSHTKSNIPLYTVLNNNESLALPGHCVYSVSLYFSNAYKAESGSRLDLIFTLAIAAIFTVLLSAFCMYDRFVRMRNAKITNAAARSNKIIASLFPSQVRDRLFGNQQDDNDDDGHYQSGATKLKNMMESNEYNSGESTMGRGGRRDKEKMFKTKPIADLFPECTILFADIAGFTAWSSVREPSQVFTLLETLFRAFDQIAKRRRVFKVETVGDCYVAATGLPEARSDHAVAMARFARDCILRMRVLVKSLEVTLGPDTADLAMRMGMHSGPVTAGVLRGERSRFQLFGDTMNTAARMEHTGERNRIQLTRETADLLAAAGKTTWVVRRDDLVHAKGKGEMQTFWLDFDTRSNSVVESVSSSEDSDDDDEAGLDDNFSRHNVKKMHSPKTVRLIDWHVDILLRCMKQIVARRRGSPFTSCQKLISIEKHYASSFTSPMSEVKEIITLPKFQDGGGHIEDPDSVEIDADVVRQLRDYISNIATLYPENSFHNFEHASHVAMSVMKLLSRIVAPSEFVLGKADSTLHDHTYGITSDPLTQFSCVFAALIHDADHPGVPNALLVAEGTEIAEQYNNKSVAEQNSVDLCWSLLFKKKYESLRRVIYQTEDELLRFRQIVVNAVMATDIIDADLKMLRNNRWDRAFAAAAASASAASSSVSSSTDDDVNRKATIVIEHLIQASDVAHTMQHWHIYRKWNERFFVECYEAFVDGRAAKNPADGWYEGEIGFFDFYIIPLAKKLKNCGVFGVSSDEYLTYAIQNRNEWEKRGRDIVNEMVESTSQQLFGSWRDEEETDETNATETNTAGS